MMFLRKLCSTNGTTGDRQRSQCNNNNNNNSERNNYNPDSQSTAALQQLPNPLNNSRRRIVVVPSALDVRTQFNNLRLRTPPPNYAPELPNTPPPSYTSYVQAERSSSEAIPAEVSVLPHGTRQRNDGQQIYAAVDEREIAVERQQLARPCEQRQQLVVSVDHDDNRHERTREAAEAEAAIIRKRQQQQQRRRRLQLEQHIATINDSSTDSSSDSECNSIAARFRRYRRRSGSARGLRDAYCPDLLNACSLILSHQQTNRNSFTSSSSSERYSDYAEIDEIRPDTGSRPQLQLLDYASVQFSQQLQQARSTPELRLLQVQQTHAKQCQPTRLERQASHALANDAPAQLNNQRQAAQEMGQNLSLRRPRISLTWVLREQQPQPPPQAEENIEEKPVVDIIAPATTTSYNNNGDSSIISNACQNTQPQLTTTTKRRHKTKHLPGAAEPLNGYATTPTTHPCPISTQKFFSNQNLLEYQEKRDPSKDLLFVCTPQRLSANGGATSEVLALAKRRNEIKKKFMAKMATLQCSSRAVDGAEAADTHAQRDALVTRSLKGTYSEPSLIAASEGNHRRHRHRKRRERNRVQKFGYEIRNVDEFLTKCSLASPANIPVVLSTSSTLYQTRPGGYQVEIPLPLGMVVNAVFKNQNWLYVQTPHAEEGYVGYACCLPLGILPPAARGGASNGNSTNTKPTPCWESNGDVFPHPCGNMTDSEKEIRLRGGTRSDGARTPRGKRTENVDATDSVVVTAQASLCEQRVDKLYLRAASQPKLAEKAYAQLRSTKALATNVANAAASAARTATGNASNDEYVVLQQQQQKSKIHVQKHMQQQQHQLLLKQQQLFIKSPPITNGYNGQHLHPSNGNGNGVHLPRSSSVHSHKTALHAAKQALAQHCLRQTLVAINTDYKTECITVLKGEIVTLCECRESKDRRQWFYVKTRDGREGYIPAEVAGHGYL